MVFLSPFKQMLGWYLKLGHIRFLPHPSQFIICLSPFHSTLYSLELLKKSQTTATITIHADGEKLKYLKLYQSVLLIHMLRTL
jgi:hypothetical protein